MAPCSRTFLNKLGTRYLARLGMQCGLPSWSKVCAENSAQSVGAYPAAYHLGEVEMVETRL